MCLHGATSGTGTIHAWLEQCEEIIWHDRRCTAYLDAAYWTAATRELYQADCESTLGAGAGALHAPAMAKTVLTGPQGDNTAGTLLHGGSAAVTDENGVAWVASQW